MKLRLICKSKIHHAVVTGADLNYVGSIGIDRGLMRLTDLVPGEKVSIWNVNNVQRIDTYAIPLAEGSGQRGGGPSFSPGRQSDRGCLRRDRRTRDASDDRGRRAQPCGAAVARSRFD